MNDHELKRAFDTMTENVRPNRVEDRVRKRISEKTDRRRVRIPRAAVVACLLALTAVSVGAYGVFRNVFIQIENCDIGVFDYTAIFKTDDEMWGNITFHDDVLEELPAYDKELIFVEEGRSIYDVGKIFDTWEDAAEWLDCGMLVSDLYGGIPDNIVFGGDILLTSQYHDGELQFVEVSGSNTLPENMDAFCMTTVQIPFGVNSEYFGHAVSLAGESITKTEVFFYTAENGLNAEIAVSYRDYPDGRLVYVATAFLYHKGLTYDFQLNHEDRDTAIAYMKQILDSLH